GKSWECIACDNRRKEISVIPFKGTATTHWEGMLNTNLHTRLVERMREVLREEREYPYLSENCLIRLREMRRMACEMGITEEWIVQQGTTGLYLFPWMGTTKLRTLQLALRTLGVNASIAPSGFAPIYLDLEHFFGGRYGLQRILSRLEAEEIDLDALPVKAAQRSMCKFDSALPAELLEKQLRSEMLAPLTKEDWGME
ncbi:MAG: hypothetical protein LBQ33_01530, partial [Oscillospiraceae bacterium]|nr:hypothetical protein [Oscillospiraceae bacterium]